MFRRKKKQASKRERKIKMSKKQKELIFQFEEGKVLQVDNDKDNKQYFKSIKEKNAKSN